MREEIRLAGQSTTQEPEDVGAAEPLDPGLLHSTLSTQHFDVVRYQPRDELRALLSHHAVLEWDLGEREGFTPKALDKPGSGIVWDKRGITFHGPKTELYAYHMQGKGRIYGIKFSPAGAKVLIDRSMRGLVNEALPVQKAIRGWSAFIGIDPIEAADHIKTIRTLENQLLECGLRPTAEQELADRVVRYVAEHPEVYTTGAVADQFGMHVRTLQLLISRQIGPGIKWIIRQFRIFEAIKALEAGERVDMGTLAFDLGYSSQSHFSNHFKAMTNTSPREYVRVNRSTGKT